MESLESKLDRLSPDQRKEVEDFVDFLMYRSGNSPAAPGNPMSPVSRQNVAPPPLILTEPVPISEHSQFKGNDSISDGNSSIVVYREEQTPPFREIAAGGDDRISRDYMDYSQLESRPSLATDAVKKVKEKLQKREEQEKPRVTLDWID